MHMISDNSLARYPIGSAVDIRIGQQEEPKHYQFSANVIPRLSYFIGVFIICLISSGE